jgi:uncharacterized phage infection (PIP) family protein YhgE
MYSIDYIELALSAIKDKIREDAVEKFRKSYTQLLETEAQVRRAKVQAQILEMSKLRIELRKFEDTYNQVKKQCGNIESVDNYLLDVRKHIKLISENKNRSLLNRQ